MERMKEKHKTVTATPRAYAAHVVFNITEFKIPNLMQENEVGE